MQGLTQAPPRGCTQVSSSLFRVLRGTFVSGAAVSKYHRFRGAYLCHTMFFQSRVGQQSHLEVSVALVCFQAQREGRMVCPVPLPALEATRGLRLTDTSLAFWSPPSRDCLYMCVVFHLYFLPSSMMTLDTGKGSTLIQGSPSDPDLNHN